MTTLPVSQAALNLPASVSNTKAPGKAEEPGKLSFTGQPQFPQAYLPSCEPAGHPGSRPLNNEMSQEGRGHHWVSGRPCGRQPGAPQGLWPDKRDQTMSYKLSRDRLPCLKPKDTTPQDPNTWLLPAVTQAALSVHTPPPCIGGGNLGSVQFENNAFSKQNENHLTGQAKLSGPRTFKSSGTFHCFSHCLSDRSWGKGQINYTINKEMTFYSTQTN